MVVTHRLPAGDFYHGDRRAAIQVEERESMAEKDRRRGSRWSRSIASFKFADRGKETTDKQASSMT